MKTKRPSPRVHQENAKAAQNRPTIQNNIYSHLPTTIKKPLPFNRKFENKNTNLPKKTQ